MKTVLDIQGMSCSHCESKVKLALSQFEIIKTVKVQAARNQAIVVHDEPLDLAAISLALNQRGYALGVKDRHRRLKSVGLILLLLGLGYLVISYSGRIDFDFLPQIRQNMGYGALFTVGLLTSLHCVAMCGGINVSQGASKALVRPSRGSLLYNLGRVLSYTFLGGVVGGLGTVLRFSGQVQGYVTIAISVMMVLMALKLLKLFQFDLIGYKPPQLLLDFKAKMVGQGPFMVGLINGLMPCGPLQSMQLYALGTGSALVGALSMFYFSLGTFPMMFALGLISSLLDQRFSKGMTKVSALIIFTLSLTMFTRGAALAGITLPFPATGPVSEAVQIAPELQEVRIELQPGGYQPIVVKSGIPVSFIIEAQAENLNGCNNPVTIPALGIEKTLVPGENEIRFMVNEPGNLTYTCWMGMMTSSIRVED